MTCSELQEVLPDLLDVPAEERYPAGFQSHLKDCADCCELVTDLRSISGEARHLAANEEPSPLLWLRISAQLRSEGVIRDHASEFTGNGRYLPTKISGPGGDYPGWRLSRRFCSSPEPTSSDTSQALLPTARLLPQWQIQTKIKM